MSLVNDVQINVCAPVFVDRNLEKERIQFYFGGFKSCPKCETEKFSRFTDAKGTNNGRKFGKDCYTCLNCRWSADFLFDQNCKAYYYEAQTFGWTDPSKDAQEPVVEEPQPTGVTLRLVKRAFNSDSKTRSGEIKVKYVVVSSPTDGTLGKKHRVEDEDPSPLLRRPKAAKKNTFVPVFHTGNF